MSSARIEREKTGAKLQECFHALYHLNMRRAYDELQKLEMSHYRFAFTYYEYEEIVHLAQCNKEDEILAMIAAKKLERL